MAVFRTFRLLPLAIIAEAIPESFGNRVEGQPQKGKIARSKIQERGRSAGGNFFEENGDDKRAGVVIGGVALGVIRDDEDGVLDDSRMVGHAIQMIEFYGGKTVENLFGVLSGKGGARIAQALVVDALEAAHVLLGDTVPDHAASIEVGAFAHGVAGGGVVQQLYRFGRNGLRIIEGNKHPTTVVQ